MKKKVLFVMSSLRQGGAERSLVNLLQTFDYEKYEVDLLLFQREGAFKIRRTGDSALELQGAVSKVTLNGIDYDRGYDRRASEYRMRVTVECSLIDKVANKVLFDNRKFVGETTFLSQRDVLTGQRNASDRVASDLARQIVDAVLAQYADSPNSELTPGGER